MKMILMLVTVTLLATAAGAEPMVVKGDTQPILRVAYDDLNLSSVRGRERLNKRVTAAVRTMCWDDNLDPLVMQLAEQRCYAVSLREASDQINRAFDARSISIASLPPAIELVGR